MLAVGQEPTANGDVQAAKAPASIRHSKVPGSLDENVNGGPPGSSVVSGSVGAGWPDVP